MHYRHTMIAAALAVMATFAQAAPTQLGTGAGDYSFTDDHDSAWYVTLGPGTYSFSSTVSSVGFDLSDVRLGAGKDLTQFNQSSPTQWTLGQQPVVLTKTTDVYIDVDVQGGHHAQGSNFAGSFWVSAVPEPGPGALLLAGLGLFGFMGIRRRRQ